MYLPYIDMGPKVQGKVYSKYPVHSSENEKHRF